MAGHKHAAHMKAYADDAAETERPWERWQWSESPDSAEWIDCKVYENAPIWCVSCGYRRKPRTLTIAGVEIEQPLESAAHGSHAYTTNAAGEVCNIMLCLGYSDHADALANGRLFATPEAAKAAYDAITGLLTGKEGV